MLVAAPEASSFYGARGLRSLVPKVYSAFEQARVFWTKHKTNQAVLEPCLCRSSFDALVLCLMMLGVRSYSQATKFGARVEQAFVSQVAGQDIQMRYFDHKRDSGPKSFHAKGIWLGSSRLMEDVADSAAPSSPVATLVCSSNLGERSLHKDVEMSAWLVTTDHTLSAVLHDEQAKLLRGAVYVGQSSHQAIERHPSFFIKVLSHCLRSVC